MDELFPSPRSDSFDPVADVEDFHRKFELTYAGKPRILPPELFHFRSNFHREELDEYDEAVARVGFPESWLIVDNEAITQSLEFQLDALVDAVYVLLGTAHLQGFNFKKAWRRVHAANMSKVRTQVASDSKRQSTYDVVKPTDWEPPCHTDLVEDHAHRKSGT